MLARAVILLTIFFTLPILLIRAQSQSYAFLDTLFTSPSDCRLPCVMGVSLKQTTWETVLEAVQSNEAVGDTELQVRNGCPYITWNWAGTPSDVKPFGFLLYNDTAELIIPNSLTLGEARLALGEPSRITLTLNHSDPPHAAYVLEYAERNMHIKTGFSPCEMRHAAFWHFQTNSDPRGSFLISAGMPDDPPANANHHLELDPRIWAKQLQDLCRG